MANRIALQKALNRLEGYLPHLLEQFPEPLEFWQAFGLKADQALDGAGVERDWVAGKLESMLSFHGAPAPR